MSAPTMTLLPSSGSSGTAISSTGMVVPLGEMTMTCKGCQTTYSVPISNNKRKLCGPCGLVNEKEKSRVRDRLRKDRLLNARSPDHKIVVNACPSVSEDVAALDNLLSLFNDGVSRPGVDKITDGNTQEAYFHLRDQKDDTTMLNKLLYTPQRTAPKKALQAYFRVVLDELEQAIQLEVVRRIGYCSYSTGNAGSPPCHHNHVPLPML